MVDFLHKLAEIHGINHIDFKEKKDKFIQTHITDFILISKEREDWKRYYESKSKLAKPRKIKVKRRRFKMPITHGFIRLHFAVQDYITSKAYNVNVNLKEIANKNRVKVITLVSAINVIKKVENTIV